MGHPVRVAKWLIDYFPDVREIRFAARATGRWIVQVQVNVVLRRLWAAGKLRKNSRLWRKRSITVDLSDSERLVGMNRHTLLVVISQGLNRIEHRQFTHARKRSITRSRATLSRTFTTCTDSSCISARVQVHAHADRGERKSFFCKSTVHCSPDRFGCFAVLQMYRSPLLAPRFGSEGQ